MLAHLARKYDRGYGHFTTRQNIQYNWPKLEDVPDMLADLASVEMHAIQTSGNCIRNVTADHFAGIAPDEIDDPRPYCEIIRQWSTLHPEFTYLPRKFKIAVTGSPADRAASEVHDIGLHLKRDAQGEVGFEVLVGGGLGRTPMLGKVIREFLPREHLLVLPRGHPARLQPGRPPRQHPQGAHQDPGEGQGHRGIPRRWSKPSGSAVREISAAAGRSPRSIACAPSSRRRPTRSCPTSMSRRASGPEFQAWYRYNTRPHKVPGYRAVVVSLKAHGEAARRHHRRRRWTRSRILPTAISSGQVRATHDQNLVLGEVRQIDLLRDLAGAARRWTSRRRTSARSPT